VLRRYANPQRGFPPPNLIRVEGLNPGIIALGLGKEMPEALHGPFFTDNLVSRV